MKKSLNINITINSVDKTITVHDDINFSELYQNLQAMLGDELTEYTLESKQYVNIGTYTPFFPNEPYITYTT